MDKASVADLSLNDKERNGRAAFLLLVLCTVGAVLRIAVAYHGGIWADEGFFLLIAKAPSFSAMIDFLRFHESHPPFFYALMRGWIFLVGSSDARALILPVAIGLAIVPAVYVAGLQLFCRRTAFVGAILVAISPALIEASTQLRPYGLLPLLSLISCWSMVQVVSRRNAGWWIAYVVSTLLMVYTHNWSWLVIFGEIIGLGVVRKAGLIDSRELRHVLAASGAIIVGFLPWVTALIFQIRHAGHPAMLVQGWSQAFDLIWFVLPSAFVMTLFGTLSGAREATVFAALLAAGLSALAVMARYRDGERPGESFGQGRPTSTANVSAIARIFFLSTAAAAIAAAVGLSTRTYLLLPRCLAMVAPLLVLWFSDWIVRTALIARKRWSSPIVAALFGGVVTLSVLCVISLLQTTRSNVRDVAATVTRRISANDLIVVIPEWYSASFNHYFREPVEQIDYPHEGVSGMVDFADVFDRVADPRPASALALRIRAARVAGRRVWLITGRRYLGVVSPADSIDAFRSRRYPVISGLRVQQIKVELEKEFGSPDTTAFTLGEKSRYDEVLPFLYSPTPRAPTVSLDPRAR